VPAWLPPLASDGLPGALPPSAWLALAPPPPHADSAPSDAARSEASHARRWFVVLIEEMGNATVMDPFVGEPGSVGSVPRVAVNAEGIRCNKLQVSRQGEGAARSLAASWAAGATGPQAVAEIQWMPAKAS